MGPVPVDVTSRMVLDVIAGKRRDVRGRLLHAGLLATLLVSLSILVTLLVTVLVDAWPVFAERGTGFLTAKTSSFESRAGVVQGLMGSGLLMGLVVLVAIPLGVAAAIYLEEYARDTRLTRMFVTNIRNLAGVPSVVYGILGLAVFVQTLRTITGPQSNGRSIISGGLTLAVLVMPLIIIATMEALRAVPRGIREAAYGVGATRWEVVRSHVLPYAAPGVFTGSILAMARAFGETAPLLLVGAVTGFLSTGSGGFGQTLQGKYTSLPTLIFDWSRQPGAEWRANAAAAIVVLLIAILVVNLAAIVMRNRAQRRW